MNTKVSKKSDQRKVNLTNEDIARLLRNVAAVYEITGADFFRIRAYKNASDAVEKSDMELKDIWEQGKLQSIPGIGASIAQCLDELFKSDRSKHFDQVLNKLPAAVFEVLKLPGVGPITAGKIVRGLNLNNPNAVYKDIVEAAKSNKIAKLEGFGEKSQLELVESIKRFKKNKSKKKRILLDQAVGLLDKVMKYMKTSKNVIQIEPLGSLRRRVSTVGDLDLAVSTNNAEKTIGHFINWSENRKTLAAGTHSARIIHKSGIQIDLKVQKPETMGSLLQHFTGSKEHNIALRELALKKGMSLSEHGIKLIKSKDLKNAIPKEQKKRKKEDQNIIRIYSNEKDFYGAIGMKWVAPELRENKGEIQAALNNTLPDLIKQEDIIGDLHIHSNFDLTPSHDLGKNGFGEIIGKAADMGYRYVGFAEHNPASKLTDNDSYALIKARNRAIEQVLSSNKETAKIRVYKLLEVDILADGTIPISEESQRILDGFIVSIHSSFRQDTETITKRILNGLKAPRARILGHPTGRLIRQREGIDADWERIFKYCAVKNIAMEINAHPSRLDLPDDMIRGAKKIGVKFVINTDAHDIKGLELMKYGVSAARRGWLEKKDVLNAYDVDKFEKWLYNR